MSIGYACIAIGVRNTELRRCILKNVSNQKLSELISCNLDSLEKIIDYNINNDIKLFRISSDLIPFGSSPANTLPWWDIFAPRLKEIGQKILDSGIRVSLHPGQYTVLNSPKEDIIARAVDDLNYHTRLLDSLGVGPEHKIVLHIGGIYNDKQQAAKRFTANYQNLDDSVKQRLVIENDDRSYNIRDVLGIGSILRIPVVFDNLHNAINSCGVKGSDSYWISECGKTWSRQDGRQKIHYSQQASQKKPGSHSSTVYINEFIDFYNHLEQKDIDIMLEVKDKNLSAVKCINCISPDRGTEVLYEEWSKYKYAVLEHSPSNFIELQELLCNKDSYNAISFYNIIEASLKKETEMGNSINAARSLWENFSGVASQKERDSFYKGIDNYQQGKTSITAIKNSLFKMAVKYKKTYVLESYYFVL